MRPPIISLQSAIIPPTSPAGNVGVGLLVGGLVMYPFTLTPFGSIQMAQLSRLPGSVVMDWRKYRATNSPFFLLFYGIVSQTFYASSLATFLGVAVHSMVKFEINLTASKKSTS